MTSEWVIPLLTEREVCSQEPVPTKLSISVNIEMV